MLLHNLAENKNDKLTVLYNTVQNSTTAFKGYEYLANNELLQKMMNRKLQKINEYNDQVEDTVVNTPSSIKSQINKKDVTSRTIEEIRLKKGEDSPQRTQIDRLGFHIELKERKNENIIQVSIPAQILISDVPAGKLRRAAKEAYQKALRNIAGLVQVLTVNKDQWETFTEKTEYIVDGDKMTLKQILESPDADKLLQQAILEPATDTNEFVRQADLFDFSTTGLDSASSINRQKIAQLVLLSGSPFAVSTGIKKSTFTDIDYLDGGLLLDIQNGMRLIQSTTKAKGVKQKTKTRYTDDSKPVEKGQGLEVLETIKKIGFDASILQKAINNKQTPGFTHKRSNC